MSVNSLQTASPSDFVLASPRRHLLSVVVPVYNGGEDIVENLAVIRRETARGLAPEDVELVVVSDGSIDGTAERLLSAQSDIEMRVIHYDRNLGKGYAVKVGTLASRGDWVAIVDADLDLDPSAIPTFLETARLEDLDFVIGSKRHPASIVCYPRSRRAASWCYQQLNRLLFRLDVRDTQVGLKVFRREVAEQVVPLLLVKQFAFDLELLAVARTLGFRRVRELPVRLDYRFTGSGVRSRAVLRALLDTAAVFYRLRILRTYQRKQRLLGGRPLLPEELPLVTFVGAQSSARQLDYPLLEVEEQDDRLEAARSASGDVVAVLGPDARPAGNWLNATVPYLARGQAAAVVVPTIAPPSASVLERAAAAILESRMGGASRRFRHLPGNIRVVTDYPAESCVVCTGDLVEALDAGVGAEQLVSWLAARGRRTVYTPDASISAPPPPLFGPHLRGTHAFARARGAAARRTKGASLSSATALALAPSALGVLGAAFALLGPREVRTGGVTLIAAYGATVVSSAGLAALRTRSVVVGALVAPALVLTHGAYVAGFVRGLAGGRWPRR